MKLLTLFIALWSSAIMATEQLSCTFYIEDNDTSIDAVENSIYKTSLSLEDGERKSEVIKIRRLLVVPQEDDQEEQRKLAYKDVIFLFEKDRSDTRIDKDEEEIAHLVSSPQPESITLSAQKMGNTIHAKIITPDKTFNLNFEGRVTNHPLEIATNDSEISDSPALILDRPYITVAYKHYSWWKVKREVKKLNIGFSCKKLSQDHIAQDEIIKDEDALLDGVLKGQSSSVTK